MARKKRGQEAAGRIPVLEIPASAVGPLGLTLGTAPDAGGGRDAAGAVTIPLLQVTWFDERQLYPSVQAFVWEEIPPDLPTCAMYQVGRCRLVGARIPCAFEESLEADVWRMAKTWRIVPNVGAISRPLWAEYGLEVTP